MKASRRIALASAWVSLVCFVGPVVTILIQMLGLSAWPQDGLIDEYAIAVTAFAVLPRLAFIGLLPGIAAVALGIRVRRGGGGRAALVIGIPALLLCSAVSAANAPLIPYLIPS